MTYLRRTIVQINRREFDSDDYTVLFTVPFDDDPEPAEAEIELYNLSDQALLNIRNGHPVIVNAGYEGDVGSVFIGVVDYVNTQKDGVDTITRVRALDAELTWNKAAVQRSYKPRIRAQQILEDLLAITGIEVTDIRLAENRQYVRGYSVSGRVIDAVKDICDDCGSKVTVINNRLYVYPRGEPAIDQRIFISAETGLMGTPERIETEDGETRYNINTLLQHRVTAGSTVLIQASNASGRFKVIRGSHTRTNSDYRTYMEVEEA